MNRKCWKNSWRDTKNGSRQHKKTWKKRYSCCLGNKIYENDPPLYSFSQLALHYFILLFTWFANLMVIYLFILIAILYYLRYAGQSLWISKTHTTFVCYVGTQEKFNNYLECVITFSYIVNYSLYIENNNWSTSWLSRRSIA